MGTPLEAWIQSSPTVSVAAIIFNIKSFLIRLQCIPKSQNPKHFRRTSLYDEGEYLWPSGAGTCCVLSIIWVFSLEACFPGCWYWEALGPSGWETASPPSIYAWPLHLAVGSLLSQLPQQRQPCVWSSKGTTAITGPKLFGLSLSKALSEIDIFSLRNYPAQCLRCYQQMPY